MKNDICLLDHHQRSLWNTITIGLKGMINRFHSWTTASWKARSTVTWRSTSTSQPNSLNPLKIERGNLCSKRLLVSQGKRSFSDRTGEHVKDEEKSVLKDHDRTWKLVEGSSHKVQEVGSLEHRDVVDKFHLAIDDENIDFNISGVPNAMVKRSHGVDVHNLTQQIENHPQRKTLQSDLQQHRAFNRFSKESKDAIMITDNTELCEIINVEPKSQCRACLTH